MIILFEFPKHAFCSFAKPMSIILIEGEKLNFRPFFDILYYNLKSTYCQNERIYYHFSLFSCEDNENFTSNKVLTANRSTGSWALRYPYTDPYP